MTTFNLTCEAVEATLLDYLDETLEPWLRKSIDDHLAECAHCAGLARDLRNIEREAAALPAVLPERDLWSEVADGIGAPVIPAGLVSESEPSTASSEPPVASTPLPVSQSSVPTNELLGEAVSEASSPISEPSSPISEPSPETPPPTSEPHLPIRELPAPTNELSASASDQSEPPGEPLPPLAEAPASTTAPVIALPVRRQKNWGPAWMGLAAAALVLVTAGSTFLLTVRWLGPVRTPYIVADTVTRRLSSSAKAPVDRLQIPTDSSAPGAPLSSLAVATTSSPHVTRSPEEVVYDKEINMLQAMNRRRKGELDASTAAVIARNLRIIDANIAQIRAALQEDPNNSMLGSQVSRALDMKVELLRRVAMLRSNT